MLFSLYFKLVAYMATDFAIFWIDSPWECGGRWMEEIVTKCDQILGDTKIRLCKMLYNQQLTKSFFVPRTGLEPVQPLRAKGFSYCYDFRHRLCRL